MDIYKEISRITLKLINSQRLSVKNLVYESKSKNKKMLLALVCGYLGYSDSMMALSYRCTALHNEMFVRGNEPLLRVLLYEHVIGEGISSDSEYRHYKKMMSHHDDFIQDQWKRLKRKRKVTTNEGMMNEGAKQSPDKLALSLPRWIRVNLLKTSMDEVVSTLESEGFSLVTPEYQDYNGFVECTRKLEPKEMMRDFSLSDVLAVATGTEFHKSQLLQNGHIILQDKASCIPAHVLSPPEYSQTIDCCAAPGNKTSHIASLINDTGHIYAFERDTKRCTTMKHLLQKSGVTNCTARNVDFLTVKTSDPTYRNVEYVLVDPSCTGSGITKRVNTSTDDTRIQKLANIQTMLLKHALSFPNVKRVVYSTCSINYQENEEVVTEVAEKFSNTFKLVEILPDIPRDKTNLAKKYDCSEFCLRMSTENDATNGFFIACFERVEDVFENEMDNDCEKTVDRKKIVDDMIGEINELEKTQKMDDSEKNLETGDNFVSDNFSDKTSTNIEKGVNSHGANSDVDQFQKIHKKRKKSKLTLKREEIDKE